MISEVNKIPNICIEMLAAAIVEQAVKDYQWGLQNKDIVPMTKNQRTRRDEAVRLYRDNRKFFRSDWYNELCSIDADKLIKRIEDFHNEYDCSIFTQDPTYLEKHKRPIPLNQM